MMPRALEPRNGRKAAEKRRLPAGGLRGEEMVGMAERCALAAHHLHAPGRYLQACRVAAAVAPQHVGRTAERQPGSKGDRVARARSLEKLAQQHMHEQPWPFAVEIRA